MKNFLPKARKHESHDLFCKHVKISGRVQGVGYRAWTQREATALGLTGTVENKPDGSVEAHFCGAEESVLQMIQRCQKGPTFARVDGVVEIPVASEEFEGFCILR